jgi:putative MATE family efflux protein
MTQDRSLPARIWGSLLEAVGGSDRDFTQGSLNKAVYLLAIPMILEMVMESVFAVTDAFFVSRLGSDALATVGLAESMLTLIYGVALGLAMGTTAMVARRIGEKRPEAAAVVAVQAVVMAVVLSVATGIPAFFYGGRLLALMGASPSIIAAGSTYTSILLGTNLVIMLLFVHNAIFRGAGDASFAMRSLWLANGINLILDPCLIFGLGPFPELGLTGAAVATTIGRGTGVLFQLWLLRSGRGRIQVARGAWKVRPDIMFRLLRLTATGAGQFLVATASWVVLIRIVSAFGGTAVAAYTLAIRIILFALLPAFGVSNAAATLVGQNLGAKNPRRAEISVWLTGLYTSGFLAVVMVIFLFFGESLVRIFTSDPELVSLATECLRVISFGYIFYAWGMVMIQAFNGAGDTVTPLWINLICFWACEIPLAWWLSQHTQLGVTGVFWAVAISETLLAVTSILIFRLGHWKTRTI